MRRIALTVLMVSIWVLAFAQNQYRVEIRQVFPQKKTLFAKAFDLPSQMDRAISQQSSRLNGMANYTIHTSTPKGSNTRSIQNVKWIQTVNGNTTYHSKPTSPTSKYLSPTIWKGYACNINGAPSGKTSTREFVYRVSLKDSTDHFKTDYVEKSTALAEANKIFKAANSQDHPVCVVVYSYSGKKATEIKRITNDEEYKEYLDKINTTVLAQNHISELVDSLKKEMREIRISKDSLGMEGITKGRLVLQNIGCQIPDSVFYFEGLDAEYRSVVGHYIPKDRDDLIALFPDSISSPSALMSLTQQLETKMKEAPPVEPAYLKEIKDGAILVGKYQYDGDNYEYYKRPKTKSHKKEDYVLVNLSTQEYQIGKFEEKILPNGNLFPFSTKKVKRYNRDGVVIK